MNVRRFAPEFLWGAATASYQIEGAVHEDGRGESIWDRFSHTLGKTNQGETGDIACDHYHRFRDDIRLMKEIGLNAYRFSIAWPRIMPDGRGNVNQKGLDFYRELVDELLKSGIRPVATLYHWDLPQRLQDEGGWANRAVIDYYNEYAATMMDALGDRVPTWITINEPWVMSFMGHGSGEHAPGLRDPRLALQVSHHLLLAHARAVQTYRGMGFPGEIGISLSLSPVYSASDALEDREAAARYDGYLNRWYLEPVSRGRYPEDMLEYYRGKELAPVMETGDLQLLAAHPVDFLGVNYYFRSVVHDAPGEGICSARIVKPMGEYTEMEWEVYPQGLYDLLLCICRDYENPRFYITENGAAYPDNRWLGDEIDDPDRVKYLRDHLDAVYRAVEDGVKVDGYFVWSLLDNFEWARGYGKRFGIFYTDYPTQRRIWKKSARWYQETIRNRGFEIEDR